MIETGRQRQGSRQTDREAGIETGRQRDRGLDRQTESQGSRQADREAGVETGRTAIHVCSSKRQKS